MEDEDFDAPPLAQQQGDTVQEDVQSALAQMEGGEDDEESAPPERWTRDERGRFATQEARGEQEGEAPGQEEPPPARAPDYWKPEFGDFGRLPPNLQNAILTRESQIHRFASDAGRRLKAWEPVEHALAEGFRARGAGQSMPDYLVSLATVENQIYNDATSGRPTFEALEWLARSYYGTDLATLAAQRAQAPQADPAVQELTDRLMRLEETQVARAHYEQEMRRQDLWNEFEAFAKERPMAKEPAMMQIMQRLLSSQEALSFQDAYEKATWLYPPAREAMQKAERQSAVRRARAAAISPRAASPAPGVARMGARQTIEEDVRAALEELS